MATTTTNISIKLQIDTKANKVVFAEASKDFVDLLFFLLSLPIGTVIKLLTSESMVGSIGNLYTSFANLNETYLQQGMHKNVLLNPMVFSYVNNIPLSINKSSIISSGNFYTCFGSNCSFTSGITSKSGGASCPSCRQTMYIGVKFVAPSDIVPSVNPGTNNKESQGYVKAVSYMISDNLSVTPMSTQAIMSMMNKLNVTKLEERNVKIGNEEALELLKISFQSKTILIDIFLGRKKAKYNYNL